MHAADHDHRQHLAGKRHRDRFGRDQIRLKSQQRAGQSRHHRRNHKHAELVALNRVALERGAQLVLADRDQDVAERRAHHPQQNVQHGEAYQRDHDVEGEAIVEAERSDAAALQAAQAVLAAGHVAPAKRDGVGERGKRQRQQREVNAAPPQDEHADEGRYDGDEDHRQKQRQPDLVAEPVQLDQSRGIGADAEPGAVAERHQPGVADAQVEPHGRDRQDDDHGRRIQSQSEHLHGERQRDQGGRRDQQRPVF